MLSKGVPLRTRRALSLYQVYGDSALLVLNGTSLNCLNVLLALSRRVSSFNLHVQSILFWLSFETIVTGFAKPQISHFNPSW